MKNVIRFGAVGAAALLIGIGTAFAATTQVTPTTMNGWYFYNDLTDTVQADTVDHGFVTGPGTPPLGTGSVHLTKATTDRYGIGTVQFASTSLSSITALSYSTYRASGTAAQAPSLGFDFDSNSNDGLTNYEGRATYEPYFTQTVNTGSWQTWDTLGGSATPSPSTGNWWLSNAMLNGSVASVCTQSNPCTWSELKAAYPNAAMAKPGQLILRTNGADGEAFNGNTDNLTVGISGNSTTFDFDPAAPVTPACSADDTTFDTFNLGSVNGQHGWSSTGNYDQAVVNNTYGYPTFGCKSLRISNAVASGSFGDQTFSYSVPNEAGETGAQNGGQSGGTRKNHFEAQFDIGSTASNTPQTGLVMSVSPDRGDGARMSYLRLEDQADGIHAIFDEYLDNGPQGTLANPALGCGEEDDFTDQDIATLDRTVPHTIKFVMDFVDGPHNDVVKVYIDGTLKKTGTSWEDYYRWCTESGGGVANNGSADSSRTVDSLLFREGGTGVPANQGKGYLVDNVMLASSNAVVAPTSVKVTIDKYIDGQMATSGSAAASSFPMQSSWTAANLGGAGSGTYDLGPTGFNSPTPYEAVTSDMDSGSSYSTNEVTGGSVVGASCAAGKPYALQGYKTGDTMAGAQAATLSSTSPAFTNITSSKYVLVYNQKCAASSTPPTATTSQVTIVKYVDDAHATVANASSTTFQFTADYQASNLLGGNAGSDPFTIGPVGNGTPNSYEAMTVPLANGASYRATENLSQGTVGNTCQDGKPFALMGYRSGDTMAAAQAATISSTSPAFTNLQSNKYVIVYNRTCAPVVVTPPVTPVNACATPTVAPAGYTLRNGTSGNDSVTLAPNTMFVGKGGNDQVKGGNGNYIVCTGSGSDTITLGNGNSVVDAGGGNNSVQTGNGDQNVTAGSGSDTVTTGSGNDTIDVGGGNNQVTSGAGNDKITAGSGSDSVNAGQGTDTCTLGGGNNQKTSCEL